MTTTFEAFRFKTRDTKEAIYVLDTKTLKCNFIPIAAIIHMSAIDAKGNWSIEIPTSLAESKGIY